MTIVVASMMIIMLTALLVLLAVFAMHLITRSPRVRTSLRRWALAAGTSAYSVRREVSHRVRLFGRFIRRRLGPPASRAWRGLEPVVERTGGRVTPVTERARPLIGRVKAGLEYVRPIAPPPSGRSTERKPEIVPVTALSNQPPTRQPEVHSDRANPAAGAR
ncbi:MAG TPA: hypothetical protein VFR23_14425 [Jiangellaceae bacterium]|nr:hypothetical protein [Jiangellaceae bacterium]